MVIGKSFHIFISFIWIKKGKTLKWNKLHFIINTTTDTLKKYCALPLYIVFPFLLENVTTSVISKLHFRLIASPLYNNSLPNTNTEHLNWYINWYAYKVYYRNSEALLKTLDNGLKLCTFLLYGEKNYYKFRKYLFNNELLNLQYQTCDNCWDNSKSAATALLAGHLYDMDSGSSI